MWELQVKFYLGKMRTIAWESAFQIALRNCSKEAGGKVSIYMFLVKGEYAQSSTTLFFVHVFLLVVRTVNTLKDFSAFLDMRRYKNWTHKMDSCKYLTIWRPVLPVPHPPAEPDRVPHFCSLHWTPFRRCWKSAASVAHDLILVVVDSEWVNVAQLCPTLRPHRLYSPWNSPGQITGVGSLSRLQEIFSGIEARSPTLQVDSLPAWARRER